MVPLYSITNEAQDFVNGRYQSHVSNFRNVINVHPIKNVGELGKYSAILDAYYKGSLDVAAPAAEDPEKEDTKGSREAVAPRAQDHDEEDKNENGKASLHMAAPAAEDPDEEDKNENGKASLHMAALLRKTLRRRIRRRKM